MVKLGAVLSSQEVFPSSSTDNALVKWDGTGGQTIQNSKIIEDDNGNVTIGCNLTLCGDTINMPSCLKIQCCYGCMCFFDNSNSSGCCLSDLVGGGSSLWVDSGSYVYLSCDKCICTSYDICVGGCGCFGSCVDAYCGFYCGGYGGCTASHYTADGNYAYFCGGVLCYIG